MIFSHTVASSSDESAPHRYTQIQSLLNSTDGQYFAVGAFFSGVVSENGRLWLAGVDSLADDNGGSLPVRILYTPPPVYKYGQASLPYMDYQLDALPATTLVEGVPTGALPVLPNTTASSMSIRVSSEADPGHASPRVYAVRIASSDVQLLNISFVGGALSSKFDPTVLTQNATLSSGTTQIIITVTGRSPTVQSIAIFFANVWTVVVSGSATTLPSPRSPTMIVQVTADDGSQQNMTIALVQLLSEDALLQSLIVNSRTLSPSFTPTTFSYFFTISVGGEFSASFTAVGPGALSYCVSGGGQVYPRIPFNSSALVRVSGELSVGLAVITIYSVAPSGNNATYIMRVLSNSALLQTYTPNNGLAVPMTGTVWPALPLPSLQKSVNLKAEPLHASYSLVYQVNGRANSANTQNDAAVATTELDSGNIDVAVGGFVVILTTGNRSSPGQRCTVHSRWCTRRW